ncbi:MAG TPA: carboxypeptidase-like regulatory domain-containing protein [Terriglobales bacterium]|nr:carboxypeptidase-like regulatory domain-containing protein [Terriglobales bacterium]
MRVAGFFLALCVCAALSLLAPRAAQAQTSTAGTIVGQVTDAQGAAIPGAVIILTNTATGAAQPTVSNNAGRYTFTSLNPGVYNVTVKKDGFKEAQLKNQNVDVGKQLTLNVPMQVGTAAQTVEVTASGAELQTMNSTVGDTIGTDAIMKLPGLTRDANSLTNLQPNTSTDGGVAGADLDQNSFTLDGGNNSDDMDGSHASYTGTQGGNTSGTMPVPAESIEQFSIGTINQTADVNSAAGASINMVTKRGTSTVHGSAYEYYLGSYLSANTWANDRAIPFVPKSKSHQNRFGASLGGQILPNWLGGKTFLFGNFEGRRFPNSAAVSFNVPSLLLRAGVVQAPDASGNYQAYNLNKTTVTVGGVAYAPAVCPSGPCDPRNLGISPTVQTLWNNFLPVPNQAPSGNLNIGTFTSTLDESLKSNFFVTRMDHDFGSKNHFTATYHFFSYNPISTAQVDIGGALPGDTLGVPKASTVRPQLPSQSTAQLTTSLSSNVTNNFNYSYLRNYWEWLGSNTNPQPIAGLGGALELGGETSGALIPYNVNTQSVRTRFWDGIGHTFSDDLSIIHGNHLFAIGGKYTHQWDYHQRNDNGGGIMAANVYQIAGSSFSSNYIPAGLPSSSNSTYEAAYNEVLGIVTQSQTLYTRAGAQLKLQPLGTPMNDKSNIPLYNVYFSDAWHVLPTLTITYGTGYTIEMPPVEQDGKQVELTDASGNLINTSDYLRATERAALAGQNYNPALAFATVANVGAGIKYPYHPFYGGLSPRVSMAWNPNVTSGLLGELFGGNKTVIRGGWARIYGRLNGVDQVLVPLLGTGLGQAIACANPLTNNTCPGPSSEDPAATFRIGPTAGGWDGLVAPLGPPPSLTLPQPYVPGAIQNGVLNPSAGSGEALDPNFRPNRSDEFDLTFQRQINSNFSTEIGYTGRIIRNEYIAHDLDSVPYMMTSGGQQFSNAFANLWRELAAGATSFAAQPFFETALGGPTSAFCKAAASCTAAVAKAYGPVKPGKDFIDPVVGNNVYSLWQNLNALSSWQLGRTFASAPVTCATPGVGGCPANGIVSSGGQVQAIFMNDSLGYGNYNSVFWSFNMRNYHGLTAGSNFTYSRSMGTGQTTQATSSYTVLDPFNMNNMYGSQSNDVPLNYNLYFLYEPGAHTQHGFIGHLAHGWSFAPVITWYRGWTKINNDQANGDCGAYGEGDCNTESSVELARPIGPYTGGSGIVYGVNEPSLAGSSSNVVYSTPGCTVTTPGCLKQNGTGINRFGNNAAAVLANYRPLVLGLDGNGNSGGHIPGLSQTLVNFSVTKNLAFSERFSTEINAQATNLFNHFSASQPTLGIDNPKTFGQINGDSQSPRTVEVGLAIRW